MSYMKVKYISINRKTEQIFLTVACSNIFPSTYEKAEFGSRCETFYEKAMLLGKGILSGEYQLLNSCNHKKFSDLLIKLKKSIGLDLLGEDFKYHTRTNETADNFIAEAIAVPYITEGKIHSEIEIENYKSYLRSIFRESCLKEYERAEKDAKAKGLVFIKTALSLNGKFPGWNILLTHNGEPIVAKSENYKNGILDNSDGSAIYLSGQGSDAYEILAYWDKEFAIRKYRELQAIA